MIQKTVLEKIAEDPQWKTSAFEDMPYFNRLFENGAVVYGGAFSEINCRRA